MEVESQKMPKMAETMRHMFMLVKRHIKIIMKDNGVDLAIHKIMSTRERNRIIQISKVCFYISI